MKRLLFTVALLLFALPALAADVPLFWDTNTGPAYDKVRIYERTGTAGNYVYTMKIEVAGTVTTATVTGLSPGTHYLVARGYIAPIESVDSNSVSPIVPGNINNLRLIAVLIGEDGTVTIRLVDPAEFFRG
jgi:hypothetical protein